MIVQKRSVCFLLLFLLVFAVQGNADIIKLKRGISFEGKVIEDAGDVYVVELSVGVVNFKKNEVDSIEYVSDMSNDRMFEEWTAPQITESVNDADVVTKEMVEIPVDSAEFVEGYEGAQVSAKNSAPAEDMVRYKGRYITPEVYDIIQKEKDIQQRRYSFIQKQKRQKATRDSIGDPQSIVSNRDFEAKSVDTSFGDSHDSIKNNLQYRKQTDTHQNATYKPYEETTKAYGFGGGQNSI